MSERFTHECENCSLQFSCIRHENTYDQRGTTLLLVRGTGKNVVYRGDMNREYAICPECGMLESQISAESRDQTDESQTQEES